MGGLFHQRNLKQFRLNVLTTFLETNFINPCRKRTWVYKDASRHFFQLHNEEKGREGPFSDFSSIRELRSKMAEFSPLLYSSFVSAAAGSTAAGSSASASKNITICTNNQQSTV